MKLEKLSLQVDSLLNSSQLLNQCIVFVPSTHLVKRSYKNLPIKRQGHRLTRRNMSVGAPD